ncbi:gephyrin-like molybdotransferase Glp [Kingella denitrificans]|uniref:molybdopterin molybdotransferase MoeA n=1 Tax=Kingella denitrificans TaxID=502 RepID=UPI00288B7EC9|nr:gephyrin-like molybdotransferase Glp [Kingella denitrificans]
MALTTVQELQTLIQQKIHQKMPQSNLLNQPENTEKIAIVQSVGRVLAQDVISPLNVPNANVSAMDGYALPQAAAAGSRWKVGGISAAGHAFEGSLHSENECVRIMTGAVVPRGMRTVVLQENVELLEDNDEQYIVLKQNAEERSNIRYAGEEITQGAIVLQRGRILREADVLLLASLGLDSVSVFRKIRVAVLSTGDELRDPGTPLDGSDKIYDSNRYMLMARLQSLPIEVIDLKKVDDDLESVMRVLESAMRSADVVISSGGVSVGDFDYLREAVLRLGAIHHYKVAIKPGKPFVFGQMGQTWYFGLPGNPISGYVGLDIFLKSALWQLCGAEETQIPQPLRFEAVLSAPVKKAPGRMDIQRALITQAEDGSWQAAPCGPQDSHRVLGISQANAYLILPLESGPLAAGERVTVQPFLETFL